MATNFLALIMMVLGSSGGLNEVLDATDPGAYFQAQGIELKVDALSAVLAEPAKAGAEAKAQEVKQLLAIKALGGLKDKAAVPALQKAAGSGKMFFKDYAEEAIAAIEGKPYKAPSASAADFNKDLASLPAGLGAVMQTQISGGAGIDMEKVVAETLKALPDAPAPEEIIKEVNNAVISFASQVGNIRIDGLTFGLADKVSDDDGFAVFIVRGLYDAKALSKMLSDMAEPEKHTIGGIEFLEMDDSLALGLVSDEMLIMVAGPGWEQLPLKELAAKVKAPPAAPEFGKDLARVVAKAKKSGSLWGAAVISEAYKEAPQLAPFDEAVLTTRKLPNKENKSLITLEGTGKDEKAMGAVIQEMKAAVKEGIAEVEEAGPELGPIVKLMKSLKFYSMGQSGSISIEVDGDPASAAAGILPMIMGMMPMRMERAPEVELKLE